MTHSNQFCKVTKHGKESLFYRVHHAPGPRGGVPGDQRPKVFVTQTTYAHTVGPRHMLTRDLFPVDNFLIPCTLIIFINHYYYYFQLLFSWPFSGYSRFNRVSHRTRELSEDCHPTNSVKALLYTVSGKK